MILSIVIAMSTYVLTMSLGITATVTNRSFGRLHHGAYFTSWAALIWACVDTINLWLLMPAIAMVLMPRTKAGSKNHTILGVAGLASWLVVLAAYYFELG